MWHDDHLLFRTQNRRSKGCHKEDGTCGSVMITCVYCKWKVKYGNNIGILLMSDYTRFLVQSNTQSTLRPDMVSLETWTSPFTILRVPLTVKSKVESSGRRNTPPSPLPWHNSISDLVFLPVTHFFLSHLLHTEGGVDLLMTNKKQKGRSNLKPPKEYILFPELIYIGDRTSFQYIKPDTFPSTEEMSKQSHRILHPK